MSWFYSRAIKHKSERAKWKESISCMIKMCVFMVHGMKRELFEECEWESEELRKKHNLMKKSNKNV
jgi:hypothetical protein